MSNVTSKVAVFIIALLLLTSCVLTTSNVGAEQAASRAFEKFAQEQGVPYKDVSVKTISNDGTYATVRVTAWFRSSAVSDWLEQYADIEVRNVGGQWQADIWMSFKITDAEKSRQNERAKATEILIQATRSVIETNTAAAATATVVAFEQEQTATAVAFEQEQPNLWNSSDGKAISELLQGFETAKENAIGTGDTSQLSKFIVGEQLEELTARVIGFTTGTVWMARNPRSEIIRFIDDHHATVTLIADVEMIIVNAQQRSLVQKSIKNEVEINYKLIKTPAGWYIEECDNYVCGHWY